MSDSLHLVKCTRQVSHVCNYAAEIWGYKIFNAATIFNPYTLGTYKYTPLAGVIVHIYIIIAMVYRWLYTYFQIFCIEFDSKLSRRSVSPSTDHKFALSLSVNCHDRRYHHLPTVIMVGRWWYCRCKILGSKCKVTYKPS